MPLSNTVKLSTDSNGSLVAIDAPPALVKHFHPNRTDWHVALYTVSSPAERSQSQEPSYGQHHLGSDASLPKDRTIEYYGKGALAP